MAPKTDRKRGRGADPAETRKLLTDAAFASLREDGFRGTTARSIGDRAGCNQAAIYYHFGGIEPLLLKSFEQSSQARLQRYKSAVHDTDDLVKLVSQLETLYVEDRSSGHLEVLAELVGGVTANPDLREGIEASIAPWLAFVEDKVRQATSSLPLAAAVPASDLADLIFSLVIGVELRNKLDGKPERSERLFRLASLAAALADGSKN